MKEYFGHRLSCNEFVNDVFLSSTSNCVLRRAKTGFDLTSQGFYICFSPVSAPTLFFHLADYHSTFILLPTVIAFRWKFPTTGVLYNGLLYFVTHNSQRLLAIWDLGTKKRILIKVKCLHMKQMTGIDFCSRKNMLAVRQWNNF